MSSSGPAGGSVARRGMHLMAQPREEKFNMRLAGLLAAEGLDAEG